MSDGHLEGHLQALSGYALRLELVETALVVRGGGEGWPGGGDAVSEAAAAAAEGMAYPRRRRQIRLVDAQGRVVVHATSLWDAALYDRVMGPDEGRAIWEALHVARFGTARRVLGVRYGTCDELRGVFGVDEGASMWSRDMLLKRDRKPMVVVSEILSPMLDKCIPNAGRMTMPTADYDAILARNCSEA